MNYKRVFLTLVATWAVTAAAQEQRLREATVAEMNAATKGLPAVVTPRRAVGISVTVSATNFPLATLSTNGGVTTNAFVLSQSTPGWQKEMERLPYRGQTADTEAVLTNVIQWHKDIGRFGFNVFASMSGGALGIYQAARSGGHLAFNTVNFPSDYTGLRSLLHTNGWRWLIWYDRANVAGGTLTVAQYIDDLQTILTWKPDILWVDESDPYYVGLAAQIVESNSFPVQLMTAVDSTTHSSQVITRGSHFRLHGSSDPLLWINFLEYSDIIETNYAQFSGLGHTFYIGPEISGVAVSSMVLQAMWSSDIIEPFMRNAVNSYGRYTIATNRALYEIQTDPAAVIARRVLWTNDCWVYLKPLKSPSGPDFALLVLNTNAASAKGINFNFSQLFGLQPSSGTLVNNDNLGNYRYGVYDWKNDSYVGYSNSIVTGSIAAQDYQLYKLISKAPQNQAEFTISNADFVSGQVYQNTAQRAFVAATVIIGADAVNKGECSLWFDQNADGTWDGTNIFQLAAAQVLSLKTELCGFVQPFGKFTFTNTSGTAGNGGVQLGTSHWVKQ